MSPLRELSSSPNIDVTAAPRCVVCGCDEREAVANGFDFEYETCSNEWTFWRCSSCSHLQLDPRPADAMLPVIYPPTYYSYQMSEKVSRFALWGKRQLDKLKFGKLFRFRSGQPGSFLDVGCGDGRYLQFMIDKGLDRNQVQGLELDTAAVACARERGLNVVCARVEDAQHLAGRQFDLITMFHVIEHLARPDEVVRSLEKLLAPGGILAIETPNFESLDARLFSERFWGGYHFPRHWHIFTPSSLERLLKGAGLEKVSLQFQTGHAFWMFSLHHHLKYSPSRPKPRIAGWLHPFRNVPLLAAFTLFDILRARLGFPTSAMLMVARKPVS